MPSIALKRPAETSHGTGLAGIPSRGHCSTAARNASCIASSARSKSPSRRISVASTLRESRRKRVATVAVMSAGAAAASRDTAGPRAPDSSDARAQDAQQRNSTEDKDERGPHRVGNAEQVHGRVGAGRARLEDIGQKPVELGRADDAVGEGEVARRRLRGNEVVPERRRDAGDGEEEGEGRGDAAAGGAAPDEAEQRERTDRDEDQSLQHAPRAWLHSERMLRDEGGEDGAERGDGDEGERRRARSAAARRRPRARRRHSAAWAISSISTQAPSGSWATP